MKNILLIFFIICTVVGVPITLANGGDQRVVENKYLINLSRAPFTPIVGIKTSFLASFVDIQKNKLIGEDIIASIRISKLGEAPKGNFIFEKNDISIKGGILDFSYLFTDNGLHEIFFDFAFASNQKEIYNAPDFLIDVQKPAHNQKNPWIYVAVFIAGLTFGITGSMIIAKKS